MSWRAEYRAGLVDVATALNRIADEMQRTNDMKTEEIMKNRRAEEPAASAPPVMLTTPAPQFVKPDPKPEDDLPDDTAEILTDD